jgi:hypothetical protein
MSPRFPDHVCQITLLPAHVNLRLISQLSLMLLNFPEMLKGFLSKTLS